MISRKTALAILVMGVMAAATPAFAFSVPPIIGDPGGGGGGTPNQNAMMDGTKSLSGNGSNGSVGDNPNANATNDLCYRHDLSGNASHTVCQGGNYLTWRHSGA